MPVGYRIERWQGRHSPNPAALRQVLTEEGYNVFQWCDRPNTVYGPHKHAEDQTHWVVSGAIELSIVGGQSFTLEAGDRDFMPAETYHAARVIGDEPVLYLIGEKRPTVSATSLPRRDRKVRGTRKRKG